MPLSKARKNILRFIALLIAVLAIFFLGANQYRMSWWPFEDGLFGNLEEILPDEKQEKMVSIFGTENMKVLDLPFDDQYPTGPFEMLSHEEFLFISKCGGVYFTKLDDGDLRLVKQARALHKKASANATTDDASDMVYCKDFSGVKDSLRVGNSLYVAYNVWDQAAQGARLAVSEFELNVAAQELTFKREIFLSHPAIKEPFLGNQVGGKLALGGNDETLFLAIGDFSKPQGVQDSRTSLGKMMKIDLVSLQAEIFASGLRSPSGGIYFDHETGDLWETEHGPRGGDEINLIQRDKNYGWPLVSYGTLYERDGLGNYYGNKFNTHEGYEKPVMAFLPSIGIGAIARYPKSGKKEYWEDSFFVAGMISNKLYRIRKEGKRLVYAEPVLDGYRIRGLKIDKEGRFFMRTDTNQFLLTE